MSGGRSVRRATSTCATIEKKRKSLTVGSRISTSIFVALYASTRQRGSVSGSWRLLKNSFSNSLPPLGWPLLIWKWLPVRSSVCPDHRALAKRGCCGRWLIWSRIPGRHGLASLSAIQYRPGSGAARSCSCQPRVSGGSIPWASTSVALFPRCLMRLACLQVPVAGRCRVCHPARSSVWRWPGQHPVAPRPCCSMSQQRIWIPNPRARPKTG